MDRARDCQSSTCRCHGAGTRARSPERGVARLRVGRGREATPDAVPARLAHHVHVRDRTMVHARHAGAPRTGATFAGLSGAPSETRDLQGISSMMAARRLPLPPTHLSEGFLRLSGRVSRLFGIFSRLFGRLSRLFGRVSRLFGRVSRLSGPYVTTIPPHRTPLPVHRTALGSCLTPLGPYVTAIPPHHTPLIAPTHKNGSASRQAHSCCHAPQLAERCPHRARRSAAQRRACPHRPRLRADQPAPTPACPSSCPQRA